MIVRQTDLSREEVAAADDALRALARLLARQAARDALAKGNSPEGQQSNDARHSNAD